MSVFVFDVPPQLLIGLNDTIFVQNINNEEKKVQSDTQNEIKNEKRERVK